MILSCNMEPILIEPITVQDASDIEALMVQLGYSTSVDELKQRIQEILAHPDYHWLVARDNGKVIGMIGLQICMNFRSLKRYGKIAVMAVDSKHRNRGIGRKLVNKAEEWFLGKGVKSIIVTSANDRSRAHDFYEKTGYSATGLRFGKRLE